MMQSTQVNNSLLLFCKLCSILDNRAYTPAEDGKTLILGLSLLPTSVNLLDDHRQFEVSEGQVKLH